MSQIRIVIAAPDITAQSLCLLLISHFSIVGMASTRDEVVRLCNSSKPHLVLVDSDFRYSYFGEPFETLRALAPQVVTVLLSADDDIGRRQRATKAGAAAVVLKHQSPAELCAALRSVAEGKSYWPPDTVRRTARSPRQDLPDATRKVLTGRQLQVLALLAAGKSTKEMADALNVSPKTVEYHKTVIARGLSLHSVAELTRYAMHLGLVDEIQ